MSTFFPIQVPGHRQNVPILRLELACSLKVREIAFQPLNLVFSRNTLRCVTRLLASFLGGLVDDPTSPISGVLLVRWVSM